MKFEELTSTVKENLLMETAMRIQEIFSDLYVSRKLDYKIIDDEDSLERLRLFAKWARGFEQTYHNTQEYDDDWIDLTDKVFTKMIINRYGITYRVTVSSFEYRTIDVKAGSANEAEKTIDKIIEEKGEEYVKKLATPYESGSYVVENEAFIVYER